MRVFSCFPFLSFGYLYFCVFALLFPVTNSLSLYGGKYNLQWPRVYLSILRHFMNKEFSEENF